MNYFLCVCLLQQLASWAGNLMLKYKHNDFPSDVFTLLECVSASLTLCKLSSSLVHSPYGTIRPFFNELHECYECLVGKEASWWDRADSSHQYIKPEVE